MHRMAHLLRHFPIPTGIITRIIMLTGTQTPEVEISDGTQTIFSRAQPRLRETIPTLEVEGIWWGSETNIDREGRDAGLRRVLFFSALVEIARLMLYVCISVREFIFLLRGTGVGRVARRRTLAQCMKDLLVKSI